MPDGSGYGDSYQVVDKQGDVITTYPDGIGPYIYEQDVQYAHPVNGIDHTTLTVSDVGSTFTASLQGTSKFVVSHGPDGSTDTTYFVTGQPYARQTVTYDATGTKTALERDYANAKPELLATYNADGSVHMITQYDTSGRVTEAQNYSDDGSHTVMLDTYNSSTTTSPYSVATYNYDMNNHLVSVSHDWHLA